MFGAVTVLSSVKLRHSVYIACHCLIQACVLTCIDQCCRFEEAEVLLLQAEKSVGQCLGQFHPALAALLLDSALGKTHTGDPQQSQQLLR